MIIPFNPTTSLSDLVGDFELLDRYCLEEGIVTQ